MAELTWGAFLPPPSNIGYARTPSKIGLKMTSKVKSNDNKHSNGASTAECDLVPISHKDFNELIKGKGFTERNKYKLRE